MAGVALLLFTACSDSDSEPEVPGAGNVAVADTKVGDFLLNDGSFADAAALSASSELRDMAVGIVAYKVQPDRKSLYEADFADKLSDVHGIVLALSNASSSTEQWNTTDDQYGVDNTASNRQKAYGIVNGYTITQSVKDNSEYPAFQKAAAYAPSLTEDYLSGTTGWFLPSYGQWVDVIGANGLGSAYNNGSEYVEAIDVSAFYADERGGTDIEGELEVIRNAIKFRLESAGFDETYISAATLSSYYWTSTECSADYTWTVGFSDRRGLRVADFFRPAYRDVRCILAY